MDISGLLVRFPIEKPPLAIERPAISSGYFDVLGRKAGILGKQNGIVQVWVYPLKVAHDIGLSFQLEGETSPMSGEEVATTFTTFPSHSTLVYSHEKWRVKEIFFVPREEAGALILLDVDTSKPLTILVQFVPDMQPMWPGGLGGQFSYWDNDLKAFVIGEGRGKFYSLLGSPAGKEPSYPPAHALPDTPNTFRIEIAPEVARKSYIPIAIAGSVEGWEQAKETYQNLLKNAESLFRERENYAQKFLEERTVRVVTPDRSLNEAVEWAKLAVKAGEVCNPHLGCGLVAGYGLSGKGARPGFAWFFGGDASINSLAILSYGDPESVKQALQFQMNYQRQDGKIAHEISQSAGFIPWFQEYPYPYYHGDTTPWFLIAMAEYYKYTGDADFIQSSKESILKAYRYCLSTDSDGDGLMENTKAGLAAVEEGPLRQRVLVDIFLASVWIEALKGMALLAEPLNEPSLKEEAEKGREKAEQSFLTKFFQGREYPYFALYEKGGGIEEITAWPGFPLSFHQIPETLSEPILRRLSAGDMFSDWGIHFLSTKSSLYDPTRYNGGAVWPFLSGFAVWGQYRYHRPYAGYSGLVALAGLHFLDAPGSAHEVFSGDYFRPLFASVPHQLFSSSPFLTAFYRGLLGLDLDATTNTLSFAPHLPTHWNHLKIQNIRLGSSRVHITFERTRGGRTARIQKEGSTPVHFVFSPSFGLGAKIVSVKVDGKPVKFQHQDTGQDIHATIEVPLNERTLIEMEVEEGIEIIAPEWRRELGARTSGLKILSTSLQNSAFSISLEGLSGNDYELQLFLPRPPVRVEGAELLLPSENDIYRFQFHIPPSDPPSYTSHTLTLHLK